VDRAAALVQAAIPPPGPAQLRREAEAALAAAALKGVTTVHDVSGDVGLETYQDLLREDRLTARIALYLPITAVEDVRKVHLRSGFGSTRLRLAGLKGFADGALGSGMALFFDPYSDEPEKRGAYHHHMLPEGIMRERVRSAHAGGLQVAVHAIGDRAIAEILDIFQEVAAAGPDRDCRFRIEHVQHLRPVDLPRLARQRVIASVQPYHAIDDGQWAERRVGPERTLWSFPYRSLLDAGVPMAFGSDWPMYPMDPIMAIHAAVTRRTLDGKHPEGWVPGQKVPLMAALHATTLGGAYAEFAEAEKGSITPGKLADFVVLDRDLFGIPPEQIQDAKVTLTLCGGRVVFEG
jgi:predicted amidohydrolase YtcJ